MPTTIEKNQQSSHVRSSLRKRNNGTTDKHYKNMKAKAEREKESVKKRERKMQNTKKNRKIKTSREKE